MPDLIASASSRFDLASDQERIGDRVRITSGPLQGLSGTIAELVGDQVLVDLRCTVDGLFVRCSLQNVAMENE